MFDERQISVPLRNNIIEACPEDATLGLLQRQNGITTIKGFLIPGLVVVDFVAQVFVCYCFNVYLSFTDFLSPGRGEADRVRFLKVAFISCLLYLNLVLNLRQFIREGFVPGSPGVICAVGSNTEILYCPLDAVYLYLNPIQRFRKLFC